MHRRVFFVSTCFVLFTIGCAPNDTVKPGPKPEDPNQLLSAFIGGGKYVDKVEMWKVDLKPGEKLPTHTHPVPVSGYVVSGKIAFRADREQRQVLTAGEAFFEPANTRILEFEALDGPAQVIKCYLMGNKDRELMKK